MQTHKDRVLDFNEITDGIYIGTNQCCQPHFDERLANLGIEADISLEDTRVDSPFGIDFYIWLPVKDHTPPSPDQLAFGVAALEKLRAMGKKVYIHCKNGHGRAPTLLAAYLMHNGMTVDKAIAAIAAKRPTIHLSPAQRYALKQFRNQSHHGEIHKSN